MTTYPNTVLVLESPKKTEKKKEQAINTFPQQNNNKTCQTIKTIKVKKKKMKSDKQTNKQINK
jgi:hypothetical protein